MRCVIFLCHVFQHLSLIIESGFVWINCDQESRVFLYSYLEHFRNFWLKIEESLHSPYLRNSFIHRKRLRIRISKIYIIRLKLGLELITIFITFYGTMDLVYSLPKKDFYKNIITFYDLIRIIYLRVFCNQVITIVVRYLKVGELFEKKASFNRCNMG